MADLPETLSLPIADEATPDEPITKEKAAKYALRKGGKRHANKRTKEVSEYPPALRGFSDTYAIMARGSGLRKGSLKNLYLAAGIAQNGSALTETAFSLLARRVSAVTLRARLMAMERKRKRIAARDVSAAIRVVSTTHCGGGLYHL